MRNQTLSTHDNKHSEDLFHPPVRWFESDINVVSIDEPPAANRELEKLYQEAQEYDFLIGKTPQVLPAIWDEED